MEQQNSFIECMWMLLGNGYFSLPGIVLYRKQYQISQSTQFSCVGVEFSFKNAIMQFQCCQCDCSSLDYSGNVLSRDVTGQYDMTRSVCWLMGNEDEPGPGQDITELQNTSDMLIKF